MPNKLIVLMEGQEKEVEYFHGRDLVNSGVATLVCYADERKAKENHNDRETKEEKAAAKIKKK